MVWLKADCDTPSFAAARVKLRACATATKGGEIVEVLSGH